MDCPIGENNIYDVQNMFIYVCDDLIWFDNGWWKMNMFDIMNIFGNDDVWFVDIND